MVPRRRPTAPPPNTQDPTSAAVLYLVATPIGNLEDITYRAVRLLGEVAVIAAEDTRRTAKLLRHYSIQTRTVSLHEHNERRQVPRLLRMLGNNRSIALVSDAGTPLLSDPGHHLVREALARGFKVQPIPGASAILAALVVSGLAGNQFTYAGFPPSRSKDRKTWLRSLADEPRPLVIFESPHRLVRSLHDARDVLGDRDIALCRELTKIHEELVKGPISGVLDSLEDPRGEFTIVVSPAPMADRVVTDGELVDLFGRMTKEVSSRRAAVAAVAKRFGVSARRVYKAVEDHKKF